jgi:sulfur relay protein TusB/DsrH
MRLHILNSPDSLPRCKSGVTNADSLILIEDAVVLLPSIYSAIDTSTAVYVLLDDVQRRGIETPGNVKTLDYLQFVDLCAAHTHCISW